MRTLLTRLTACVLALTCTGLVAQSLTERDGTRTKIPVEIVTVMETKAILDGL